MLWAQRLQQRKNFADAPALFSCRQQIDAIAQLRESINRHNFYIAIAVTSNVYSIDNVACASAATISGSTSFANVSFISALGRIYKSAAGSMQTMLGSVTVDSTAALPIVLVSSTPGQYANFNSISAQQISNPLAHS